MRLGGPAGVRQQRDAILHEHWHIVVAHHLMRGLRQVAVGGSRTLRTVQLAQAFIDAGS